MMRCSTLVSIKQATSWLLQVLMAWPESIMCLLVHARRFFKVMKTKSVKSHSTHKATRSSQQAATRRADCGPLRPVMKFNAQERTQARDTRMKFSPARSIMRVTRSLRVLKITPAAYGRIKDSLEPGKKKMQSHKLQPSLQLWEGKCQLQLKHNRSGIERRRAAN